ncbi:serine hydrolase [Emticicia sp. BO119]|uniref:serine hydrolase n=1 Tax=Emticicia sp. BO119 TaxID=2757768 RepID=UPI0015F051DC|nr:serine hydrolase [Emticicia sp. BO119]MBA4853706.1 serine hydrolase [Emticicia sp. BO119]
MKKLFFLFTLSYTTFAQSNQKKIDSVRVLLEKAYNEKNSAKIFELAGETFQKQLPETEINKVINQLNAQLGAWKSSEFQKNTDGVAQYKGTFEKANQNVLLSLDKQDKISTLFFQPYTGDKPKKDYPVATDNKMTTPLDMRVDSVVRPYIQWKHTASVAIAVIKDGKVYTYNYGETKRDNKTLPDPDKTLYEIGSISKTFTATLLAEEVVKGKMSLEDPINKYLPDSIGNMAYKDVPITLKTLSNHSSGFPRLPINLYKQGDPINDPYKNYDTQRMFTYLKNFKPFREVGVNYEYSNFAVGLLGQILATYNHTSYEKLLQERITKPLKMKNTFITIPADQAVNFAQGYNEKGEATSAWDLNTLAGAGGIRSTINDLVKYINAQMDKAPEKLQKAIDLTHQVTFEKGQTIVGLGWHTGKMKEQTIFQHSGGTGGFRTLVAFDKENKIGVVVLSNTAEEVAPIGFELLKK